MRMMFALAAPALITASAAALAKEPCPAREPGRAYPWQTEELSRTMPRDQWATLYIDIDEAGRPLKCAMGDNNIPGDNKFWVCRAFLEDWHAPPIIKDGKPVRGTVKRLFVAYSYEHVKALKTARKEFFRAHPDQRPECYPE